MNTEENMRGDDGGGGVGGSRIHMLPAICSTRQYTVVGVSKGGG